MRHLLIAAVLIAGALLITSTIAGLLESRATRDQPGMGRYSPPEVPSANRPTQPEQSKSLPVVYKRTSND